VDFSRLAFYSLASMSIRDDLVVARRKTTINLANDNQLAGHLRRLCGRRSIGSLPNQAVSDLALPHRRLLAGRQLCLRCIPSRQALSLRLALAPHQHQARSLFLQTSNRHR